LRIVDSSKPDDASILLGQDICGDWEKIRRLEWLETNGIGGFASLPVGGPRSRPSHGLLWISPPGTAGPNLLLAGVEETLLLEHRACALTPPQANPTGQAGAHLLTGFHLDLLPSHTYSNEGFDLRKSVFMPFGEDAVVMRYERLRGSGPAGMAVRPVLAFHSACRPDGSRPLPEIQTTSLSGRIIFSAGGRRPLLQLAFNGTGFVAEETWFPGMEDRTPDTSGKPGFEILWCPGVLKFDLASRPSCWIVASTRLTEVYEETVAELWDLERLRRRSFGFAGGKRADSAPARLLLRAADQFIVRGRNDEEQIVAGYPVARDWGLRESLVALPGLTLVTGRWTSAYRILKTMVVHGNAPKPPGTAGETLPGQPAGLPADTPLWFVYAVDRYLRYSGDLDGLRSDFYPVVKQILQSCIAGELTGIRLDSDGLLDLRPSHPGPASIGAAGEEVTLRPGKPVELQALWYNALSVGIFLAQNLEGHKTAREFSRAARACAENFLRRFWNSRKECLYSHILPDGPDPSVRAGQVLAAGLPHSMLDRKRLKSVVNRIEQDLLVPCGVRDVARDDPAYRGTAWGWYLGFYATAYLNAFGRSPKSRAYVENLMQPCWEHLAAGCLGSASERFDGEPPYHPQGAAASPLSVAEWLRVYGEILLPGV